MSKMFSDMQLSKDLLEEFYKGNNSGKKIKGIDFSAEILSNGTWPTESMPKCDIPECMTSCTNAFRVFYSSKHTNRRLMWLYNHGQVEVTPTFTQKPY